MKIFYKILLVVLPLIAFSTILVATISYYVSREALQEAKREILRDRLSQVLSRCRNLDTNSQALDTDTAAATKASIIRLLRNIRFGETGYLFAVDRDGIVQIHPDQAMIGRNVSLEDWYQNMVEEKSGFMRFFWMNEMRWGVFDYCALMNWYVISSGEETELAGVINRLGAYTFFVVAISLGLATVIISYWATWLTNPIHTLIEVTNRVRQGFLGAHIPISTSDEIGVLAGAFNAMSARLCALFNSLEKRHEQLQQEIGERKRAEEELKQSEQRYALAQKVANIGSWDWDLITDRLYWSERIESIFGFNPGTFGGTYKAFLETVHPDDREAVINSVKNSVDKGIPYDIEHRIVWPNETIHWISETGNVVRNDNGKTIRMLGIVQDITAQKEEQAEREALIRELETKNAELERFTYTVSHDLKTPLITISGFLGFLEQDAAEGNVTVLKEDIQSIYNATQKMGQLLSDLLEISRIGRLVAPPQSISMFDIAREAVELVSGRLTQRSINVHIDPDLPMVYADRSRLIEVLENLIDNAAKFMGDQPHPYIEIGMAEKDGEQAFYVKDNGSGIDLHYKEKIFGLFDKLNQESEGSGVGLAIVKRIIELHGGRVWVESEGPGKGSAFYFTLPNKISLT